jgi:hypothetical protein
MKTTILFLFALAVALFVLCLYGIAKSNKIAYENCVAAGIQSNDTCYFYAYQ